MKDLIEQALNILEGVQIKKTGKKRLDNPDHSEGGFNEVSYDIIKDGETIGTFTWNDVSGDIEGKVNGKDLPHGINGTSPDKAINRFLKSGKGKKFN